MPKKVLNKWISFMLAAALVLSIAACGSSQNGNEGNVTDASGEKFEIPEMGLRYTVSKDMLDKGIEVEPYNWNMNIY